MSHKGEGGMSHRWGGLSHGRSRTLRHHRHTCADTGGVLMHVPPGGRLSKRAMDVPQSTDADWVNCGQGIGQVGGGLVWSGWVGG